MNVSLNVSGFTKKINGFFERYHSLAFFVVLGIGLMACILLTLQTVNSSGDTDNAAVNTPDSQFDEATISRLRELSDKSEKADFEQELKRGRSNPFIE